MSIVLKKLDSTPIEPGSIRLVRIFFGMTYRTYSVEAASAGQYNDQALLDYFGADEHNRGHVHRRTTPGQIDVQVHTD